VNHKFAENLAHLKGETEVLKGLSSRQAKYLQENKDVPRGVQAVAKDAIPRKKKNLRIKGGLWDDMSDWT